MTSETHGYVALRARLLACAALIAGGMATEAAAQATPDQATPDQATRLGEIVVTAQRRSERLQDVPMSITALSADSLEKAGVTNTADLTRVTPGLQISFYGNNLQPAIRGVTATGGSVADNPSVAIYLDGAYQSQQIGALFDLPDVQQIEVLKGPQGTLYGQNATGGAIIITTQSPSFTPTGKLSASYGNYNNKALRGFVTGPVNDMVAVSLAAAYQKHEGFRRNVATGQRDMGLDSKTVRGKVLVQPIETAKFTLGAYYADRNDSAQYAGFPLNNNSVGYALIPSAPRVTSAKQFAADPRVFNHIWSWGFNLKGEFDLAPGKLTTITSTSRLRVKYLADIDASPVNYAEVDSIGPTGKYFSQSADFASRKFGRLSFLAGALYLHTNESFTPNDFILRAPAVAPVVNPPVFQQTNYDHTIKAIAAVYAEAAFDVTDKLALTAGGRYTHEKQRAFYNGGSFVNLQTEYPGGAVSWSKFSPRVTARYKIGPASNVYASFSQGFKGGLILPTNFSQPPVNPETNTSYEIGYKGRPLDNLTLNASAFLYNYKQLQVSAYKAPVYTTQNAASARGKGVDVDTTWAATPELTISAGVEYLDARYRKYPNAQGYLPSGFGSASITEDLSGKRLLRSPKWSGNVTANYQVDAEPGRFGAFASIYATSAYGLEGTDRISQAGYATLDAELSFSPNAVHGLRLVAWGKNLTNKAYLASAVASNLADLVSYAEPRTFGGRVEYAF